MGIEKTSSELYPVSHSEKQPLAVVKGGQYPKAGNEVPIVPEQTIKQQIEDLKKDIVRTAWYEQMKWGGYDVRDIPPDKIPTLPGTLREKNIQLEQLGKENTLPKPGLWKKFRKIFT